jgi:hypothetical protein
MKRFLLAALLAANGFSANATVIDFNGVTGNSGFYGSTYQEEGFQLAATLLYTIRPNDQNRYTGTTSFYNGNANGITIVTKVGGGAFSFDSIDLDGFNNQAAAVTFIGTLLNNSTTSLTFTTNATYGLQTFAFTSAFDNVKSVSWTQASPFHSFDNIVVNATAVPEPTTVALLGLGLLGFAASRRKVGKTKSI